MSDDYKVKTDTPMVDEIVHNCKQIIRDGVILKDDKEADSYETERSMVRSDLYLASIDGVSTLGMHAIEAEDIISAMPNVTMVQVGTYMGDPKQIPKEFAPAVLKAARARYIDMYDEENEYYRMYNGLAPHGTPCVFMDMDLVPDSLSKYVDPEVPVNQLPEDVIIALENEGVIDKLLEANPECTYLRYIGKRRISIYEARKAGKFAPLYVPECDVTEIRTRFQELLEHNRTVYLKFYYDDAYDYGSDYYQKFMIIMIILQTFCDMIVEVPEYLIRKDIFDIRTVQYFFEANGVRFFPEIPLRYQISLVRNLNKLIKYKSSDKCIVDIVSLFGFDNIEVFKYYILKSRKKDADGNYVFSEYKDPNTGEIKENLDECYGLKFLKVGLEQLADDAIKDPANHHDYEELTRSDQYWRGDHTEDAVRREILEYDFNMLRTKYMSIKSVYSMSKYAFQMSYFLGMIMNGQLDLSRLLFEVPYLNMSMNITDAFVFMYALAHVYEGSVDKIDTKVDENLKVLGFNFEADLEELSNYLWETGVRTFEDLGIDGWKAPRNGIFTFNQLMSVYTNNRAIYDHVVHEMTHASNKRIYDLYKKIYDSLMITDINNSYFVIDDKGTVATSYAEFLKHKNGLLYSKYMDLVSENDESRNEHIATTVYNVACAIEEMIDMKEVEYVFSGLPAASIEAVKVYVMDIVNFFKSFKVSILDLNTIYVFDDKLQSGVLMIDDWSLKCFFNVKEEVFPYTDRMAEIITHTTKKEAPFIEDRHYIAYKYSHQFKDNFRPTDTSSTRNHILTWSEMEIRDKVASMRVRYRYGDRLGITKERVIVRYV